MDIEAKKIWQVAAGDTNRNYADLCLKWDVILNGPGSEGPWPDCVEPLRDGWELSSRKITDLRRFCEDIEDGDIVVLRMGTTDVLGVGTVVGAYAWRDEFCDVDGWDLQHIRRVRWLWKNVVEPKTFDTYTLKFGDTVQIMDSDIVRKWLGQLDIDEKSYSRPIRELPSFSTDFELELVDFDAISEYLFDHGVASTSIQKLLDEIDELIRIAKWYQKSGNPSESETLAYLVIPLLRALGWTPQRMAIEWQNVDVALFNKLPRSNENLSVVVEGKPKDMSCLNAVSQAQYYAEQEGRESCHRLLVTDGTRYGVYLRREGIFPGNPHAYLNLTHMRSTYPILECHGTREALLIMSADWVLRDTKE
jgi:hypothetical protein